MKTIAQHDARRLRATLMKSFPGASKRLMSQIIATAHEIAMERTNQDAFNALTVTGIIRWSRVKIRQGIACSTEFSRDAYFLEEQVQPTRDPSLDFEPDGCFYLTPNENWSGKGSAGKNHLSN